MPQRFWNPPNLAFVGVVTLTGAVSWSLLGVLIAALEDSVGSFIEEWFLIQGFFNVGAAIFLGSMGTASILDKTLRRIFDDKIADNLMPSPRIRRMRRWIISFVLLAGTLSTTNLGFRVGGASQIFMWATCLLVCALAGFATWHTLELITVASGIRRAPIQLFAYSPGETRNLRSLAEYFTVFGVGMTGGYAFAFAGTMSNPWIGNEDYVRVVQFFWPLIYVPICLSILLYPHIEIHSLIRREKDRVISGYQSEINAILNSGKSLKKEDIEQVNALADLISKVEKSPNFALNLPITLVTAATSVFNIATLFFPRKMVIDLLQQYLLG